MSLAIVGYTPTNVFSAMYSTTTAPQSDTAASVCDVCSQSNTSETCATCYANQVQTNQQLAATLFGPKNIGSNTRYLDAKYNYGTQYVRIINQIGGIIAMAYLIFKTNK